MRDKDIEKLLIALDDRLVQNKILMIIKNQSIPELIQNTVSEDEVKQYSEIKMKLDKSEQKIIQLEENIRLQDERINTKNITIQKNEKTICKLQDERDRAEERLSDAEKINIESRNLLIKYERDLSKVNSELHDYKEQFLAPIMAFEKYCSLPENITYSLSNILSTESVIEFLIKGVQWDNIQGLEDFILANLDYSKVAGTDMSVLQEVYDQLFDLYGIVNRNCSRIITKVGEEFDLDYHTKGPGSKGVSGKIEKVLFNGYRKGNNIRKSVVLIEG